MTTGYFVVLGAGAGSLIGSAQRLHLEALGLHQAVADHDLELFVAAEMKVRTLAGVGFAVGSLFPLADGVAEPRDLRALLEEHWGAYLAILTSKDAPLSLLRDPSGAVACFWTMVGETLVATDQADLLVRLGLIDPAIDWRFLLQDIVFKRRRGAQTGLLGITELAPGQRLSAGGLASTAWSPWRFTAPQEAFQNMDEAAQSLRGAVERCVQQTAAGYSAVSLELSGGLDSSIVAMALRADPRLSAFNAVSEDAEGDERAFAADVAMAAAIPLVFKTLDAASVRLGISGHFPRPARPGRLGTLSPLNDALAEHARDVGAQAFIGGMGGDSVFFYTNSAVPVADRLLREGPVAGVVRTALDVAKLNNATVWAVLKRAWRLALRPDLDLHRGADYSFLTTTSSVKADVHPWLVARPKGVPPGRQRHVASIAYISGFLDGHGAREGVPQLSPLLAQPIVETSLRIPSWLSVDQGRDRAVARAAFQDLLPPSVLHRRSKGAIDRFVYDAVLTALPEIGEVLVGGVLDRQGLLDSRQVKEALKKPDDLAGARGQRLLALADAEYWARAWFRPEPP